MDNQVEIPLTEKKSKVKHITFKKEWRGTYGAMFDFTVEFENGDKGVYQTNNKDQDNFVIGTEADYSIESKIKGRFNDVWIKFIPKNRNSDSRKRNFEKNYRCDNISVAARYTTDLMVAGKLPQGMKFGECFNMIYKVMDDKLEEVNNQAASKPETEKK